LRSDGDVVPGLKPESNLEDLRGAEAPLFHGCAGIHWLRENCAPPWGWQDHLAGRPGFELAGTAEAAVAT